MIPKTVSIKINDKEYKLEYGWNLEINTKKNPGEITLIWESPDVEFREALIDDPDCYELIRLDNHKEFRVYKNKIPDKVIIEMYADTYHPVLQNTTIWDAEEYNKRELMSPITENECFKKNLRKYFKLE